MLYPVDVENTLFTITTEVMGRMKVLECLHVALYFQIHYKGYLQAI